MAQLQWHHFVTILSQLSILSPFCHNLVTIYDETTETIQQQQAKSSDRGILQWDHKGHFCHWNNKNFLNSVEVSFQMIIDACEFSVPALY